jgi:4-hydroxy-3-methylbut-2-en-1-yl diphosphate synthase IspG/GcpE
MSSVLKPLLKPKPKPAFLAEVSDRLADKVRRNPGNVRVSVRDDADGTTLVERPRRDPRIVTINFRALEEQMREEEEERRHRREIDPFNLGLYD